MENKNIRLVYIGLAPYNSYAGGKKIGETLLASPTFALKEGMSMEEAYKVISYLSLKVERDYHLNPGCRESVIRVCSILENYGFKKVNEDGTIKILLTGGEEVNLLAGEVNKLRK